MREIGKEAIEDMAVGAAVLGTGGGGDPHIGKLMALQAVEEYGPVQVLTVDEINDEDAIVPIAMMGAPTVMLEKTPSGQEAIEAFRSLENYLGKDIKATMPMEAGGVNSMLPLALAATLDIPVVDVDGMGQAFPELQMTTFYLNGVSATPMVLGDEKGNSILLNTVDNNWTERIARSATIDMGGSTMVAIYPMEGSDLKAYGVHGTLALAEDIGHKIRFSKENNEQPIDEVLAMTNGYELFQGKVTDVNRKTQTGFARGEATIEGLFAYKGDTLKLYFQNEHLLAQTTHHTLCMAPDLIAVLDAETGLPITTEGMRYGSRCVVVGLPSPKQWRTEKGIETCGPRYFGYDIDYTPVETLVGREAK